MSKLMIVDDHPLYREGVVSALSHLLPATQVVAAASVRRSLELMAQHPDVDLVLIDWHLPGTDGFEALTLFAHAHPSVARVLISGERIDDATLARVMRLGACGFIPKTLSVREMVQAISRVLDGDVFVPDLRAGGDEADAAGGPHPAPDRAERARTDAATPTDVAHVASVLSVRQLEVLSLLGQGRSNKEIARLIDIAERTVKAHASRIYEALGASNRTQAVLVAQKIGLISS